MKTNSNSLYLLIDSLSSSEKRYFQIYANNHQIKNENKSLELYNIIAKNKIHSDQELFKKIDNTTFKNHVPVAKIQLFQNIMKSLDLFYKTNTILEQIKTWLHQAQILLDRKLIIESKKLIAKAKKQAIKYEYFSIIPEIMELSGNIISYNAFTENTYEDLENFHQEKKLYKNLLHNNNSFWNLHSKLFKYYHSEARNKNNKKIQDLNKWFNNDLLKDENNALSVKAKIKYFQIKALQCFLKNDKKGILIFHKKILEILDTNIAIKETNLKLYIAEFKNYIIGCAVLQNKEELKIGLKKIKLLPEENIFKRKPNLVLDILLFRYNIKLELNLFENEFQKNIDLISNINNFLLKNKNNIFRRRTMTTYFLFSYSLFGAKKYEESLTWINIIVEEDKENVVADLQISARLVLLLVHYELDNEQFLEYQIKNVRRFLRKNDLLGNFESLFLSTLLKLLKTNKNNRTEIFYKLKENITELINRNKGIRLFKYFNFLAWVNTKLSNIEFIVKR